MFVFLKCKNHWARKRFAKALNNERVFHSTNNDRDEVIEHIKYGIKHSQITCQQEIEDETTLNPFELWQGANFNMKIVKKDGDWNYDKSDFD